MRELWRRDRAELCVLALTFGVSLARTVELAVLAGALGSLAVLLRQLMRPTLHAHTLKVPSRLPGHTHIFNAAEGTNMFTCNNNNWNLLSRIRTSRYI